MLKDYLVVVVVVRFRLGGFMFFSFDTIMFRPPIPVSNSNNGEMLLTEYRSSLLSVDLSMI